MTQTVYLDVYFAYNFLLDVVLLVATRIIIKNNKRMVRTLLSAMVGALYSVFVLIINFNIYMQFIGTYIFMAQIMVLIAFGRSSLKRFALNVVVLYLVTFVMCGVVNAIYYNTEIRHYIQDIGIETVGAITIETLMWAVILIIAGAFGISDVVSCIQKKTKQYIRAQVIVNNHQINIIALIDTGNSLYEPMTHKPVSVIEEHCIDKAVIVNTGRVIIPFHSIGKNDGVLEGIFVDEMIVADKVISKPVIALYKGRLSKKGKYQMLLHPEMIE